MKKNIARFLLPAILTLLSIAGMSQKITRLDGSVISADSLNRHIQKLADKAEVAGLAVSILNEEGPVYQKTFGTANRHTGEPLHPTTIFYGASFSKAIFGVVVLTLVEEGIIDLDRPLVDYLDEPLYEYEFKKDYRSFKPLKADERHRRITARMCLSHTAGLPNWRWIEDDKTLKIKFEPGTQYSYSGEGMWLLQFVIEQITGKGLEALARERVFDPLEMDRSSYVWQDRFENDFCLGHDKQGKPLPKKKRDEANAAGSLETTLADYTRFMQALLQRKLLADSSYAELFEPQIHIYSKQQFGPNANVRTHENRDIQLAYGLSFGLLHTAHSPAFFKEGHDNGWNHYSIGFPDRDMAIILMSNSSNGESIFKEVLEVAVRDTYTPWYWENYIPYNYERNR